MVLTDKLSGKVYEPDNATEWTRTISDTIKQKLKGQAINAGCCFIMCLLIIN